MCIRDRFYALQLLYETFSTKVRSTQDPLKKLPWRASQGYRGLRRSVSPRFYVPQRVSKQLAKFHSGSRKWNIFGFIPRTRENISTHRTILSNPINQFRYFFYLLDGKGIPRIRKSCHVFQDRITVVASTESAVRHELESYRIPVSWQLNSGNYRVQRNSNV